MNQKYHKIFAFIISLTYVLLLFKFSVAQPVFRFLVPLLFVFCAVIFFYNRSYLKSIGKYNSWVLLRSVMLYLSGFCVFMLLPTSFLRAIFLLSAFFVISFFELALGNFAENLLIDETLIIAFGLFLGMLAADQYFPNLSNIVWHIGRWRIFSWQFSMQPFYLAGVFFVSLLLTRAFYELTAQTARAKWISSVVIGLFCSELFWALAFLPWHYSAKTVVLFCLFYFCVILNYYNFYHTLTIKKIQFHLILIILACGMAVLATPWKILG